MQNLSVGDKASDGHNVAISHPEGIGLKDAMTKALKDAKIEPADIDYVKCPRPLHIYWGCLGNESHPKCIPLTSGTA